MSTYEDILYDVTNGVARVTINRPDRMNALRPNSYEELIDALDQAAWDEQVGVIVLTGAGDRAFCIGGDNAQGKSERRGRGIIGVPVEYIHSLIRDAPKPVIAREWLCDRRRECGDPLRFDHCGGIRAVWPGWPKSWVCRPRLRHRLSRPRRRGKEGARDWYLCRRYTATEAVAMGLANVCVPDEQLDEEVQKWCDELMERSPTALAIAKRSFNADTEHLRGVALAGFQTVGLYYNTDEAKEMGAAFKERRKPKLRGD